MKVSHWLLSLLSNQARQRRRNRTFRHRTATSGPWPIESLESRILLASDFGDAPAPYPTTLADGGAEHITGGGLTLGSTIDSESDGTPSVGSDADGADEDGVTFGTIVLGALGATATVNVQGTSGKLDAWIDFSRDGNWGGPGEQIAASRDVVVGDNVVTFDVPSYVLPGQTYARFRLSTAGGLGPGGVAADGEVEDYVMNVALSTAASGRFSSEHTISNSVGGRNSVYAADMDRDGDMDIVTVAYFDDKITWLENDGSQNFTEHTISTLPNGPTDVTATDLDGDGDMDVVGTSTFDDTVAWYENDGNQVFTRHVISAAADAAQAVFTADLDGDGDTDVLSANATIDNLRASVAWYENDGSENFVTHPISFVRRSAMDVFAADLNNDGHMDVLSASSLDDTIAWYENDGSETFSEQIITTTADGAQSVFAGSSGGRFPEVITASQFDDTITRYYRGAGGGYLTDVISMTADGATRAVYAEVNGDTFVDMVSISKTDGTIAWYEGSVYQQQHIITDAAPGADDLVVADINSDGLLDVLVTHSDNTIAWYENESALDFGDAPAPWPTSLADNGPRHTRVDGLAIGVQIDGETDGQPDANAAGDDSDGTDDEDGILSPLDLLGTVGAAPTVTLQATNDTQSDATLAGWIDYNQDGVFDDATERATVNVPSATAGPFTLTFPVIPAGSAGRTAARFRLSTGTGFVANPEATGAAGDGEVEDYMFDITAPSSLTVPSHLILGDGLNGLPSGLLDDADLFGSSVASLGDFDGDGVDDIAVGATDDENGGYRQGAVYILLLNANGTVRSHVKISDGLAGLPAGTLDDLDRFGTGLASLGDLDGDGVTDLAVGAAGDEAPGGSGQGAVYILFLNSDGTVRTHQKITDGSGGLAAGTLADGDSFGTSVAALGDLDADGVVDLVVGAELGEGTGTNTNTGTVHVLLLHSDGTVKSQQEIGEGLGGMPAAFLDTADFFGASVAPLGDLDGDGVVDLAVGAHRDEGIGAAEHGAVYVLFLNSDGTVRDHQKITDGVGGLPSGLFSFGDRFGISLAAAGDLNGDGVTDLVVGADGDGDGALSAQGAIYLLQLTSFGVVRHHEKIADGHGLPPGSLSGFDRFGSGVSSLGDFDGDGVVDLVVGVNYDDVGGDNRGAVWILKSSSVATDPMPAAHVVGRNSATGDWWVARSDGNSFANQAAGFWAPTVGWLDVLTADVNGDGHGDVVGRDPASGDWWVGLADADGNFTNQNWGTWDATVTWLDVNIADVNGDGNDDIVGRQQSNGNWWAAVSDGVGGFTNQLYGYWAPTVTWLDVSTADVNGDGNDDIVGRQQSNGNWWVGLSDGLGSFTNQLWGNWTPLTWIDVNIADVNGDGNDDVIGRQDSNGNWWVSVSDGAGSFTNQLWGNFAAIPWADVTVADVNGDGHDDVVARQQSNGNWWVGLSDGVSAFTNQLWGYWAPSIAWVDVSFGDVDGDGDDDIIGREQSNGRWWVGRSDGAGSFGNELWGTWDPAVAWTDVALLDDLLAI